MNHIVYSILVIIYTKLHWIEGCICNGSSTDSMTLEFFMISDSRTGIRCGRCKGLVGWWDNPRHMKKIVPFKRAWSEEECLTLRQPILVRLVAAG
jgi:hypothetical protein